MTWIVSYCDGTNICVTFHYINFPGLLTPFFLNFCKYCTESSLAMMTGMAVAHKLTKTQSRHTHAKNKYNKSSKMPLRSSPQGDSFKPCPYLALGLHFKPINCKLSPQRRLWLYCKSIPSCNCPGKERKFSSFRLGIWTVILKGGEIM